MGKKLVVDVLSVACDLSLVRAREVAEAVFGTPSEPGIICEALLQGDSVVLSGFGTFEVVVASERKVRNVRTGEPMVKPPGRRIRLRVGKTLRDRMSAAGHKGG